MITNKVRYCSIIVLDGKIKIKLQNLSKDMSTNIKRLVAGKNCFVDTVDGSIKTKIAINNL